MALFSGELAEGQELWSLWCTSFTPNLPHMYYSPIFFRICAAGDEVFIGH